MADKVDDMHNKLNGDLNVKISEMHHLMLSMASVHSAPRAWSSRRESLASSAGAPLEELQRAQLNSLAAPEFKPPDHPSIDKAPQETYGKAAELEGQGYTTRPPLVKSASAGSAGSFHTHRRTDSLIPLGGYISSAREAPPQYEKHRQGSQFGPRSSSGSSQALEFDAHRRPSDLSSPVSPGGPMMLPPPAIGSDTDETADCADPYDFSMVTATEPAPTHLTKTTTTEAQYLAFRKIITQDAAVLCQV